MSKTIFTRDETNRTLTIERRFPAARSRVWRAFTDAAILDQWWAPAPWKTETIRMDFQVGGYWLYAMSGPAGERHHGRMDYLEIEPEDHYYASDVFCDEQGKANESLPRQTFDTRFSGTGDETTVIVVVQYASLEDMETVIAMGMQEGIAMAQNQLAALLEAGAA